MIRSPLFWAGTFLAAVVAATTFFIWRSAGSGQSWLIIAVVVNLNVLALAVPGYFVARRLVELMAERRRMAPGSRFKTRLVATMVLLVSGPVIVVFLLSSRFVTDTIDRWFGEGVERPLSSAVEIGRFLYQQERQRVLTEAARIASSPGTPAQVAENDETVTWYTEAAGEDPLVDSAFRGSAETDIITLPEGAERVRAAVPRVRPDGSVEGVVTVTTTIPHALVGHLTTIRDSYEQRRQLGSVRGPVKAWYILLLSAFTFLTLVLAIATGLILSRTITVPIQALVEGTERVARGEAGVRVEIRGRDEIGTLAHSFNRMVTEIENNREDLQQAYRDAHRRRLFMETIIENIATGVIFLDSDGQVETINNAACSILGIPLNDLVDINVRRLLDRIDSEELRSILHSMREAGFNERHEEIRAVIQGHPRVLRVYLSNLRDALGNPTGILVVFDDLTDLINAQRAFAWQEVARRMAHEIKNPLTPIKLSAERLQRKFRTGADDFARVFPAAIKTIVREVEYLRSMVNEFSRLGKMPDAAIRTDDPHELIREIAALYEEPEPPLVIDFDIPASLPPIQWDREQIHRVLINLIDNAIEAVQRRGVVSVHAGIDETNRELVITVEDNGPGIPPEDRDRLFSPHFSKKKGGTGLGLAIVDKIVGDHRGTINVEDRQPRGARFVLRFPLDAG